MLMIYHKMTDNKKVEMFLDYFNNFLSVEGFAEHYGLTNAQASEVIESGRLIHEERVAAYKVPRKYHVDTVK